MVISEDLRELRWLPWFWGEKVGYFIYKIIAKGGEEGRGRGAPLDICDEKAEKKERRKKGKEMKEKETSSTTTLEL